LIIVSSISRIDRFKDELILPLKVYRSD